MTHAGFAQDEREPGWYDTAELSFVGTDGNSESTTLGFANKLERLWTDASLVFSASALRAESTAFSRYAVGTPDDFRLVEDSVSNLTAENYDLGLRYDRDISETFFWYTGAQWTRNQFAGFDSRFVAAAGVGNTWWDRDAGHFRTDYALTYTTQDDLVSNAAVADSFLGAQLGWDFARKFGNATYTNLLKVDLNADETEDLRADMIHALAVSMTERLALKVSLHWLYDNLPALAGVALLDANGLPTGTSVLRQLDELDQVLTVALVVSF
jgi:putative salt-induced outer membrane protein YdiY